MPWARFDVDRVLSIQSNDAVRVTMYAHVGFRVAYAAMTTTLQMLRGRERSCIRRLLRSAINSLPKRGRKLQDERRPCDPLVCFKNADPMPNRAPGEAQSQTVCRHDLWESDLGDCGRFRCDVAQMEKLASIKVPSCLSLSQWLAITETQPDP